MSKNQGLSKSYDGIPEGGSPRLSSRRSKESNVSTVRSSSTGLSKKSSGNLRRQPSGTTAAEAAAKLSLTWPPLPENKAKTTTEGASLSSTPRVKINPKFMNEMRNLLHDNPEILKKNVSKSQGATARSRPLKGPQGSQSREAEMSSSELATLKQKLEELAGRKYKPSRRPKWEDVESMWPGFDHKPIPNWQQYAIPPKTKGKIIQDHSTSSNTTPRSRSKVGQPKPKIRQARMVTHCGGCQY